MMIVWSGTEAEHRELFRIVKRMCHETPTDCIKGQRCPAHSMVLDQRILDGLLFARRIAPQLRAEEGLPQ